MKKYISFFMIFVVAVASVTVFAEDSLSDVKQDNSEIPFEISHAISDSGLLTKEDESVTYQVDDALSLINDEGKEYVVPALVESEIVAVRDDFIEGETEYTVDLEDVTEKEASETIFASALSHLLGSKVYADSNDISSNSTWDATISVQLRMTVHWRRYDSGYINITSVSGGYTRSDPTVAITGSSVMVAQGDGGGQQKYFNPGLSTSWSYATGFTKTENHGWVTHKYAKYTVSLRRGGRNWTAVLDNVLGG